MVATESENMGELEDGGELKIGVAWLGAYEDASCRSYRDSECVCESRCDPGKRHIPALEYFRLSLDANAGVAGTGTGPVPGDRCAQNKSVFVSGDPHPCIVGGVCLRY